MTYRTKEISLKYYFFLVAFEMLQRKKSNIRQTLLQRQQHSLFPLKEKKTKHNFTFYLTTLSRAYCKAFSLFFGIEKVTVILFVKKDAVPTQTTAPVQDSHIQHCCRHHVSYLWLQAVSLNKYGADIPVLVYNFSCPLHKTMDYWFKIEFQVTNHLTG